MTEKLKFVLGSVENIVGKGENAGNQHFLHFQQCFQKVSISPRVVKSPDCVVELNVVLFGVMQLRGAMSPLFTENSFNIIYHIQTEIQMRSREQPHTYPGTLMGPENWPLPTVI